jgi:hypothetical protein
MRGMKSKNRSEEEREKLIEAGWESRLRGGLIVWRRPGKRGSWYAQRVAIELLEFLEEEKDGEDGSP